MITVELVEEWIDESKTAATQAYYLGWTAWSVAFVKRVKSLEKVLAKLKKKPPSLAEAERRTNLLKSGDEWRAKQKVSEDKDEI